MKRKFALLVMAFLILGLNLSLSAQRLNTAQIDSLYKKAPYVKAIKKDPHGNDVSGKTWTYWFEGRTQSNHLIQILSINHYQIGAMRYMVDIEGSHYEAPDLIAFPEYEDPKEILGKVVIKVHNKKLYFYIVLSSKYGYETKVMQF